MRVVLTTEQTAMRLRLSHTAIKCQLRTRSQKGTKKANGSYHLENQLLKLRGIKFGIKPINVQPTENN